MVIECSQGALQFSFVKVTKSQSWAVVYLYIAQEFILRDVSAPTEEVRSFQGCRKVTGTGVSELLRALALAEFPCVQFVCEDPGLPSRAGRESAFEHIDFGVETRPAVTSAGPAALLEPQAPGHAEGEVSLTALLEALRPDPDHPQAPQPPGIQTELRPFQRRALAWMTQREALALETSTRLDPLFWEFRNSTGKRFFCHRVLGYLVVERPLAPPPQAGGALADEMGLGKTLEVCAQAGLRVFDRSAPLPTKVRLPAAAIPDSTEHAPFDADFELD